MLTQQDRIPGVLIVDADPRSRAELSCGMRDQGWQVWAVPDGDAAVEIYREEGDRIDIALVDLQLPGLHGTARPEQTCRDQPGLAHLCDVRKCQPLRGFSLSPHERDAALHKANGYSRLSFILHEMIVPVGKG